MSPLSKKTSKKTPNQRKVRKSESNFLLDQDFYKKILDSLEDYAVFTIGLDGNVKTWSVGAEKILGYKEREIIGKSFTTFFSKEDVAAALPAQELKRSLKNKREVTEGWRFRKGKKKFYSTGFVFPLRSKTNKVIGFTKIMRDRTERKKLEDAQKQLLRAEQKSREVAESIKENLYSIFMQAPALIGVLRGKDGKVELFNPLFKKLWGDRDVIGKPMRSAWPDMKDQGIFELIENVYKTGEPFISNEYPADIDRLGNGIPERAYFNFVFRPLLNLKGTIDGVLIFGVDVTSQVRDREQLQENQERLNLAQKAGKIGTFEWMIRENKIIWTPELEALYGMETGTFDGKYKTWVSLIHPDDVSNVEMNIEEALNEKKTYSVNLRVIWADGSIHWLMTKGNIFFDANDEPVRMVGLSMDITEQKRVEDALRQSERHYANVVSSLGEGVVIRDMDGSIRSANASALRILGVRFEEIQGLRTIDVNLKTIHEDGTLFLPEDHPAMKALKTGEIQNNEVMGIYRPDGELIWILVNAAPLSRDENEKPYAIISSFVDITFRKELEQQKDTFIGIASHELKTPITSMKLFTDILSDQAKTVDNPFIVESAEMIQSQSNRLIRLINELLDVSKIQAGKLELHKEEFDLDDVITEIVTDIQYTTQIHSIIYKSKPGKIVCADPERIGQVLTNFLTNAIKYSPRAEEIIVRVRKEKGNYIVDVEDFGYGIPKNEQDKVFDRFFRTDFAKQKNISGFGLGLYISAEIIKRHNGTLSVQSTLGKGSTFSFSMPAAE
ncbi:MAG: PAS domain S-box protein [bacterium]|nr:PAS domain S-box protein [bacterium]